MRIALTAIGVYLAAVVEMSLLDAARIGHVTPDLFALVAMVYLLSSNGRRAFVVAGLIALIGDLVAPGRIGVGMAWMLLVGFAVSEIRTRLKFDHPVWLVLTTCAAVSVWATAVGVTARVIGDVTLPWVSLLQRGVGVGLYTAAVSIPVWMVIHWIRHPLSVRRARLEGL